LAGLKYSNNKTLLRAKNDIARRVLTLDGVVNEVSSRMDESIRSPHLVFEKIIKLGVGNQVGLPTYGGEGLVSASMVRQKISYTPIWPSSADN